MNLYKELQQLKAKQYETHALDASTLDTIENYMVSDFQTNLGVNSGVAAKGTTLRESMHTANIHPEMALLDNATSHTILRDILFFSFTGSQAEA